MVVVVAEVVVVVVSLTLDSKKNYHRIASILIKRKLIVVHHCDKITKFGVALSRLC